MAPIERLRDTLIAKPWRTAYYYKASIVVFRLSKGPTGGHYSQIRERSAAAGLAPASICNVLELSATTELVSASTTEALAAVVVNMDEGLIIMHWTTKDFFLNRRDYV